MKTFSSHEQAALLGEKTAKALLKFCRKHRIKMTASNGWIIAFDDRGRIMFNVIEVDATEMREVAYGINYGGNE